MESKLRRLNASQIKSTFVEGGHTQQSTTIHYHKRATASIPTMNQQPEDMGRGLACVHRCPPPPPEPPRLLRAVLLLAHFMPLAPRWRQLAGAPLQLHGRCARGIPRRKAPCMGPAPSASCTRGRHLQGERDGQQRARLLNHSNATSCHLSNSASITPEKGAH